MKHWKTWGSLLMLCVIGLSGVVAIGQETPEQNRDGFRGTAMFGATGFNGGYLKYTYSVASPASIEPSISTTEILPLGDGTYQTSASSTSFVTSDQVGLGLFGVSMFALGVRIPTVNSGGTVDLSPLDSLAEEVLAPNHVYLLPDGGNLKTLETGEVADVDVVYGIYTHADYDNVVIHLAIASDLDIRNLLPMFPYMDFEYSTAGEAGEEHFMRFSAVELVEFIWEP
ncbi:hypothetical protein JW848_00620 [Candidatus Bipolaricaulota bacterium]|nr:hypothetical protein [Candidatus Bipolaricaulota bacterium]